MSELIELRARIKATKVDLAKAYADLADAKAKGMEQLELIYGSLLVELLKKKNRLEERAAALAGEYSHPSVLLTRVIVLQALWLCMLMHVVSSSHLFLLFRFLSHGVILFCHSIV